MAGGSQGDQMTEQGLGGTHNHKQSDGNQRAGAANVELPIHRGTVALSHPSDYSHELYMPGTYESILFGLFCA